MNHLSEIDEFEPVDIEPLIIDYGDMGKWIHPFIKNWYQPHEDSEYDEDVYRMYITNDQGHTIRVFFKSDYLNERQAAWAATGDFEGDEEQWPDPGTLFKSPFISTDSVLTSLCLTLTEDTWIPAPPMLEAPIKSSRAYVEYRMSFESEQFCFSEFGEKIGEFFEHDVSLDFFSLDCALTTDGNEWWCDS